MFRITFAGSLVRLAALVVCAGSAVLLSSSASRAQTPSAEQMDMFQNLPADQQQAILESLGRGGGGLGSQGGTLRPQDRNLKFPELVRRGAADEEDEERLYDLTGIEREPRLKASGTLLLSLEVRQFKGRDPAEIPPAPSGAPVDPAAAAQSAAAAQGREPIVRSAAEAERLNELRTRILRRNPYQLDKWGILAVPELGPIPLAGLTAPEARMRVAAEPLLADFVVQLTYLPVKPVGAQALKPFGYDAFEGVPSTFAPATDVPVPAEYVVGPGDTLEVQLTGSTKGRYRLTVQRDGEINFPEIGAIAVAGMRFEAVREMLEKRVAEQLIGTQASIQIGQLRSIRVFVLGDARQPGSYTVSGLSTITNALFVSGGVRKIGSLRNIELKRDGRTVARFDLYDLLLRGDTRADMRLLPGDVIFIPPVGPMAGITGEVRRPALYELKGNTTTADLIATAGGLMAEADAQLATIDRVDRERQRIVVNVNAPQGAGAPLLRNGDVLNIPAVRPTVDQAVKLIGHVFRPGEFEYRQGLRITDLLPSIDELRSGADQHYVLVRREVQPTRRVEFFSADLVRALQQRGGEEDIPLQPRDQVFVFDLETGRDRLMEPLLREIQQQSTRSDPRAEVSVGGRVNAPGVYPLERGMRISDLVRAGGSLNEAAYGGMAELIRYTIVEGESRQTDLISIDLAKAVAGDPAADIALQPFDYLVIKELPLWGSQEYVEIKGEVRFPGRFPIQRGETLRSVLTRAGGLTELAFARGSVFTRDTLKERERTQVNNLTDRLQTDLAQVSLMAAQEGGGNAAQALSVGQQLLQQLRNAVPIGRLVIDLNEAMQAKPGSIEDVILKNGDTLIVPRLTQEVTVIGEVQSATSHLYREGLSRKDYIELSGGITQRADKGRIYVVKADGSVVAGGFSWFGLGKEIETGDTIVVPLDAERIRPLPLWTAVTQIIYNLAVPLAAIDVL